MPAPREPLVAPQRDQRYRLLTGYLGYASRGARGLGWEVGATASHLIGDARYDYAEAYVGLIAERWNLRIYYAPDYFGRRVQTVYAELDASVALRPRLRLFSHLGALTTVGGQPAVGTRGVRGDARLGVGLAIDPVDLQLAWVGASRGGPAVFGTRRGAWVLSVSAAF